MQMDNEARDWLDATVKRIVARHHLSDPERAGVHYELMSHLHAAGQERARVAGRATISVGDLAEALSASGGEEGLSAAFVQPLARPVERVLFWRRFGAFLVDAVLLGIVLSFLHGAVAVLFGWAFERSPSAAFSEDTWGLMPWGFHDPTLPLTVQGAIAAASAVLVMAYFTWLESREGRTLGKRALDLRVVRTDGRPMTTREAFVRNLVKLSPPFLAIETLVMLLFFQREKQRISDKIAGTIVVRA